MTGSHREERSDVAILRLPPATQARGRNDTAGHREERMYSRHREERSDVAI